jgi:AraC-like DNA-binding protein
VRRYFNRASSLEGVSEVAAEVGADVGAALKAVGLRSDVLRKPEERIDFEAICALFEYCADNWNLPDFGLRLAPYQHLEILGPVSLVTRMESDLRGAINAITRNLVVHSNAIFAGLEEEGDVAIIRIDTHPVPVGTRQYILLALGVARNVLEQAGKAPVELVEVSIRWEDFGVRRSLEKYFKCPVRFGAEQNAISFDRKALDKPIEQSDTAYHAIIERYLATARQDATSRITDEARNEIARQMEFGGCTLESIASSLRMEPRSLQRRLQQEGHSFRSIVEDWRRERALSLVTHTRLPLSEVSLALGYSEQSIFSRAFQRWHGETPLAYRRKMMQVA